jgi:hypothetical protein
MRISDFKTMNPEDKFVTPRAAPPVPGRGALRLGSSPLVSSQRASSRSPSPTPTWKRLFGGLKRSSTDPDRDRSLDVDDQSVLSSQLDDSRSIASSDGSRTRDISPESLRRFLQDDTPFSPPTSVDEKPSVFIPEDIAEEPEDDENFATSAVSENMPYATCLSPPPFKRSYHDSSTSLPLTGTNDSSMTLTKDLPSAPSQDEHDTVPNLPQIDLDFPRSRFSVSSASSIAESLNSPCSPSDEVPSFYDDDDDILSSNDGDTFSFQPLSLPSTRKQSMDQSHAPYAGYSLPQTTDMGKNLDVPSAYGTLGSPALIARNDAGMPVGNTSLLAVPIDAGLEDLANELGWMVDAIRGKGL